MFSELSGVDACLPPELRKRFRNYFRKIHSEIPFLTSVYLHEARHPYWKLLPQWLIHRAQSQRINLDGSLFLKDILSAQYCLFLYTRIHDDILDCEHDASGLVFAADLFLLHSQSIFSRHFHPSSTFWKYYQESIRTSLRALSRAEHLQKVTRSRPDELLRGYSATNRILAVGVIAVVLKYRRRQMLPSLLQFCDHMAVGSQILDDLEDVNNDFVSGKYNYAALIALKRCCHKRSRMNGCPESLREILSAIEIHLELLSKARSNVKKAGCIAANLGLEPAGRIFELYDNWFQWRITTSMANGHKLSSALVDVSSTAQKRKKLKSK